MSDATYKQGYDEEFVDLADEKFDLNDLKAMYGKPQ